MFHRFGDRARFAIEIGRVCDPSHAYGGCREVDVWAAGRNACPFDKAAYVPQFVNSLEREHGAIVALAELEEHRLAIALADLPERRFGHWGPTTDDFSCKIRRQGAMLVLAFKMAPAFGGERFEVHIAPSELLDILAATMNVLRALPTEDWWRFRDLHLAAYGVHAPPGVNDLLSAAKRELRRLADAAGGGFDKTETRRYCDDAIKTGFIFGPDFQLSADLFRIAFPDWLHGYDGEPPLEESLPDAVAFPELFAFAAPLASGIQYGFVVRAPEVHAYDRPIAEWDPGSAASGIHEVAATSREGVAVLLSRQLARLEERAVAVPEPLAGESHRVVPGPRARIHALADAVVVDLDPSAKAILADDGPPPDEPAHEGYRFAQSSDGIGVFAPEAAFGTEHEDFAVDAVALDEVIAAAERALAADHPASALWIVREARARARFDADVTTALVPLFERAYLALGRPVLAERAGLMRP